MKNYYSILLFFFIVSCTQHNKKSETSESYTPDEFRFRKVLLAENIDSPMELAVAKDGKVYFVERGGSIKVYIPKENKTKLLGKINVKMDGEDGLLGLTLDPEFLSTRWIYLFYTNPEYTEQHISRFNLEADTLDLSSEKILLKIPIDHQRHEGGSLTFDPAGNLYISTGENTHPGGTNGHAPTDDRPERKEYDTQRSASNTNDLRGKILRIHPEADGTYTIPEGNLFPKNDPLCKPEIYIMGCRNPFRITIDPKNSILYWGEIGPDAGADNERGPMGYDEINRATKAGNFGWPYVIADNKPYSVVNYADNTIGPRVNPEAPENNSKNNTGLQKLPPAQKALIWYPYSDSKEFTIVGKGGRSAIAGGVYHYDPKNLSKVKFPKYFDNILFTGDWMRNWLMAVKVDENGKYLGMEPFMPSEKFLRPMDMQFGPDGALYMLEYGTNWFGNKDSKLVKIEYVEGNRPPVVKIAANVVAGDVPMKVKFSSLGSLDHDKGDGLVYEWRFNSNKIESREKNPEFVFTKAGIYHPTLTVTDEKGMSSTTVIEIKAGNSPPEIGINLPHTGSFFWNNLKVPYEVSARDKEDGILGKGIDANNVKVFSDYIETGYDIVDVKQGHEETEVPENSLIAASDCKACHTLSQKSVGPTFMDISRRYATDVNATERLAKKIISGGTGAWGSAMMSAHPQLNIETTRKMVKYILALTGEKKKRQIATRGILTIASDAEANEDGQYLLTALYKDRGNKEISSLSTTQTVTLRHPKLIAKNFDSATDVINVGSLIKMPFPSSTISYTGIDLQNVGSITYQYKYDFFAPNCYMEIHIDKPNGPMISKIEMKENKTKSELMTMTATITDVKGIHTIFFVFNPDLKIHSPIYLDWIYFNQKDERKLITSSSVTLK